MAGASDFVLCRDGRIVPVPSGVYVHNRPVDESIDVLGLAAALVTEPIPGLVLVHVAPNAERAAILLRFLGGLGDKVRAPMGVKPPQNVLGTPDVAELEELSDLYDASLILPVLEVLRASARAVPVNAQGRESGWSDAVAVRLLTRVQAADRASVIVAGQMVTSGQAPSMQRLTEWSARAADIQDRFHVVPAISGGSAGATVQHAYGAYLARYAVPGTGPSDPPETVAQLRELVGGTFEPPPQELARAQQLVPGASVLVSFPQSGSDPGGLVWLFAGADGRMEMQPPADSVIAGGQADVGRWIGAMLASPSTRVLAVDATSAPAPATAIVPRVFRAGGAVFVGDQQVVMQIVSGAGGGVALVSDQDWLQAEQGRGLPENFAAVVVHGASDGLVWVATTSADGTPGTVQVTPDELVEITRDVLGESEKVVLASCWLGSGMLSAAQKYATARKGDVLASTAALVAGATVVGDPAVKLVTRGGQAWRLFVPEGLDGEGFDTLNDVEVAAEAGFDPSFYGVVSEEPPRYTGGLVLASVKDSKMVPLQAKSADASTGATESVSAATIGARNAVAVLEQAHAVLPDEDDLAGPVGAARVQVGALIVTALRGDDEAVALLAALERVSRTLRSRGTAFWEEMEPFRDRARRELTAHNDHLLRIGDAAAVVDSELLENYLVLAGDLAMEPLVTAVLRSVGADPEMDLGFAQGLNAVREALRGVAADEWQQVVHTEAMRLLPVDELVTAQFSLSMFERVTRFADEVLSRPLTEAAAARAAQLADADLDAGLVQVLPPGFGERLPGAGQTAARHYAFGAQGLAHAFAGIDFGSTAFGQQVARMTSGTRVSARDHAEIAHRTAARIAELGSRNAVQHMLEGGLETSVGLLTVRIRLENVAVSDAQPVRPSRAAARRHGETDANPMDAITSRTQRLTDSVSNSQTFDAGIWISVAHGNVLLYPNATLSGTAFSSSGQGTMLQSDGVSSIGTNGERSYFDMPARLVVDVSSPVGRGTRSSAHAPSEWTVGESVDGDLRLSFPENLTSQPYEPGEWQREPAGKELSSALEASFYGVQAVAGLGALRRAVAKPFGASQNSVLGKSLSSGFSETTVLSELPRWVAGEVPLPSVKLPDNKTLVQRATVSVFGVQRIGPSSKAPVNSDKSHWDTHSSNSSVGGSFAFAPGIWISPGVLPKALPYVTFGGTTGTSSTLGTANGMSGGAIRRVMFTGATVPYRLDATITLKGFVRNKPDRRGEVTAPISVVIRVPVELVNLFEAAVQQIITGRTVVPPSLTDGRKPRFPPAWLTAPKGRTELVGQIGLTGSQKVIPEFRRLLDRAVTRLDGGPAKSGYVQLDTRNPDQEDNLLAFLETNFGQPDQRYSMDEISSPGGISKTYVRELGNGDSEQVTFSMAGERTSPTPVFSERVDEAVVALIASSYADTSTSSADGVSQGLNVGTRWFFEAPIPSTFQRFTARLVLEGRFNRGHTDGKDLNLFAFRGEPLATKGPAWLYSLPNELVLTVHVRRVRADQLLALGSQKVERAIERVGLRTAPQLEVTRSTTIAGQSVYLVPEALTLEVPARGEPAAPARIDIGPDGTVPDKLTQIQGAAGLLVPLKKLDPTSFPEPVHHDPQWWKTGHISFPVAQRPANAVDLHSRDRVLDVQGVAGLRERMFVLLEKVGIRRDQSRPHVEAMITNNQLRGVFVRGAGAHVGELIKNTKIGRRRVRMAMLPVVVKPRALGVPINLANKLQLEYGIALATTVTKAKGLGVAANFRAGGNAVARPDLNADPQTNQGSGRIGFTWMKTWSKSTINSLSRSPGQQLTVPLLHQTKVANVRWQLFAFSERLVMGEQWRPKGAMDVVSVAEGITYAAPLRTRPGLEGSSPWVAGTDPKLPRAFPEPAAASVALIRAVDPHEGAPSLRVMQDHHQEFTVPLVRASAHDPTLVPEFPLLPLLSIADQLLPVPGDPSLEASNPVLDAALQLVSRYDADIVSGMWTLAVAGATMDATLDGILAPGFLSALGPVLRGSGLVLSAPHSQFPGRRVTQLIVRQVRDPGRRGYVPVDQLETATFTHYSRGEVRSGKGFSSSRERSIYLAGAQITDQIDPRFVQEQAVGILGRQKSQAESSSGGAGRYRYDSFEATGELTAVVGQNMFRVHVVTVWRPSPSTNTVLAGIPLSVARKMQRLGESRNPVTGSEQAGSGQAGSGRATTDQASEDVQIDAIDVLLGEEVSVPTVELKRPLPPSTGRPAVELWPETLLPAYEQDVVLTSDELKEQLVIARFDPAKVGILFDEVVNHLYTHGGTPALLVEPGQIALDELRMLMDAALLENHLIQTGTGAAPEAAKLVQSPLRAPAPGGLTDTTGEVSVSFRLIGEKLPPSFAEAQIFARADASDVLNTDAGASQGSSRGTAGGAELWLVANAGDINAAPGSSDVQQPLALPDAYFSTKTGTSVANTSKIANHVQTTSVESSWYGPVWHDALVTFTLKTKNERDHLKYGGTRAAFTFRVSNLMDLRYSPEKLLSSNGLSQQVPIRVASGWFVPARQSASRTPDDAAVLRRVQQLPAPADPSTVALHVRLTSTGELIAYDTELTAAAFTLEYVLPIATADPELRTVVLATDGTPAVENSVLRRVNDAIAALGDMFPRRVQVRGNTTATPDKNDLAVFFMNLPTQLPVSVGTDAAFDLITGMPEPQLRRFAADLVAELVTVRDATGLRWRDAAGGKELWGALDGGVLELLSRASVDSLREQVSQLLLGYDFTRMQVGRISGWGPDAAESEDSLPPVDVLVKGLITAERPAPDAPVPATVEDVRVESAGDAGGSEPVQHRLVSAPQGAAWVGRVLPLGVVSEARVEEAVRWAEGMLRPVIVVGRASARGGGTQLIDDLEQVLRRFEYGGMQPVVQVLDKAKSWGLRDAVKAVVIERSSVGMEDRWSLYGPDGALVQVVDVLTGALFDRADGLTGVVTGRELPAVLFEWLVLSDPAAIERYVDEHLDELVSPELVERLGQVPFEDAGMHRTVLNLVLRNGGRADPGGVRFAPAPAGGPSTIAPLRLGEAVAETFALDYLRPQRSLDERKAWNDQLVQLVDLRSRDEITRTGVKGLAVEEMLALAANTHDEITGSMNAFFSQGMGTVFAALAQVLRMSQEKAAGPVTATTEWLGLLARVATCDLSPAARQIVIHQFDRIRDRLIVAGRRDHAALVASLTDAIAQCT